MSDILTKFDLILIKIEAANFREKRKLAGFLAANRKTVAKIKSKLWRLNRNTADWQGAYALSPDALAEYQRIRASLDDVLAAPPDIGESVDVMSKPPGRRAMSEIERLSLSGPVYNEHGVQIEYINGNPVPITREGNFVTLAGLAAPESNAEWCEEDEEAARAYFEDVAEGRLPPLGGGMPNEPLDEGNKGRETLQEILARTANCEG